MKKFFLILTGFIGIMVFFNSCGPTSQEAAQYNDNIIKYQREAYQSILDLQDAFSNFVSDNDFQKLKAAYNKSLKTVDSALNAVEKIKAFYQDSSLVLNAKKLFTIYKQVLEEEFSDCLRIYGLSDEEYTDKDREQFIQDCESAGEKLNQANKEFFEIQKQFAKNYNLELDTTY